MAHGQGATSNRRGGYGPFDRGPRGHGKDKSVKKAEQRDRDPRYQQAMDEARQAQADLDALIEKQKMEPAVGPVAGAMFAAQRKAAEQKAAEAEEEAARLVVDPEVVPEVPKPRKFSVRSLPKEGEGNFEFALTTARRMMKQGYNIQYVIEFTGVGYLDLDNFPLDRDGYMIREEEDEEE